MFLKEAAAKVGVCAESVSNWQNDEGKLVNGISFVQALARARQNSAEYWVNKATRTLESAQDAMEIHKARELAHHYRWIAKMFNPARYSEKMQVEHTGTVEVEPKALAPEWLLTRLQDREMRDITPQDPGVPTQLIEGKATSTPS